jgi:hypothetical protein
VIRSNTFDAEARRDLEAQRFFGLLRLAEPRATPAWGKLEWIEIIEARDA